jgi:signal recognition particle GTPase
LKLASGPATNGSGRRTSPESKSFSKSKSELNSFQQKMEELDKFDSDQYDSISEVKCRCPEKNCIYVSSLRTLTTHLAEKHPKINIEFRTRMSEYFDQKCDACQFYFYSRSALYNHRSTRKCEVYSAERLKYNLWIADKGMEMQANIIGSLRESIKYDRENKRKSLSEALISDPKKARTSEGKNLILKYMKISGSNIIYLTKFSLRPICSSSEKFNFLYKNPFYRHSADFWLIFLN